MALVAALKDENISIEIADQGPGQVSFRFGIQSHCAGTALRAPCPSLIAGGPPRDNAIIDTRHIPAEGVKIYRISNRLWRIREQPYPGGDYGLIIKSPVSHRERWGFCVLRGACTAKLPCSGFYRAAENMYVL